MIFVGGNSLQIKGLIAEEYQNYIELEASDKVDYQMSLK